MGGIAWQYDRYENLCELCWLIEPSDVSKRRWTRSSLVQMINNYLTNATLLSAGLIETDVNYFSVKQNIFFQENIYQNVVSKISAMLLRPHFVECPMDD